MDGFARLLRTVGVARLVVLMAAFAGIVALLAMLMDRVNAPGMSLLYGNLNPQEISTMVTELETRGVPYEVRGETSVFVPQSQVGELRLSLAGGGFVGSSTEGYAIFDNQSSFGTTSLVQNINARRALEGELAQTIQSLPAVQAARVHIVMPERRAFTRQNVEPSAAVTVQLGGRVLAPEQVTSIAELIAAAVPELMAKNVTIVDQRGNLLSSGGESHAATFQERVRHEIEKDLETSVESMLERVVGAGKAVATVTASLNFDRLEEVDERYDPEGQVARSEQIIEDTMTATESATNPAVGATGNIPGGDAGGAVGANENQARTEETINYEISKTVRRLTREGGSLEALSVAVLVEGGTYPESGDGSYQPMSDERRSQLENLVRAAIGFDEARGDTLEVVDMPFSPVAEAVPEPAPLVTKNELFRIGEIGALILALLVVIFLALRPSLKALQLAAGAGSPVPAAGGATAPAASGGGGSGGTKKDEATVDISQVSGRVKESSIKQVQEVIDTYPEESLGVVRGWMAGQTSEEMAEDK